MPSTRRAWTFSRTLAVATLAVLGPALKGCAQDEPAVSLPDEYLGQWYYHGSSGGFAGTGMGDEATGWIVIRSDNTIARHADDGSRLGVDAFSLARGPSIFSVEDVWLLQAPGSLEQVIRVSDGGGLSLSDNVYDGFHFSYERSRPEPSGR